MEKLTCFLIGLLLFLGKVYAQPVYYLGIEEGLSNNTVTSIHKDRSGLMWFGTIDGVNSFDGYNFKAYRNRFGDSTSLPHDHVNTINSDLQGNIWVGTQKGLGIFDGRLQHFSGLMFAGHDKKFHWLTSLINDIEFDAGGTAFVASNEKGIVMVLRNRRYGNQVPLVTAQNKRLYDYDVTSLHTDGKRRIWAMVTNQGLCRYDPAGGSFKLISAFPLFATGSCSDNTGRVWIATAQGLWSYVPGSRIPAKFNFNDNKLTDVKITHVESDRNNQIWITTDGHGLIKLDPVSKTQVIMKHGGAGSISSNAIYTMFEDESGRKWIGTLRGGINVIDGKKYQFSTIKHAPDVPNSLINNFTFSFCEDRDQNLWIGTDGGGLSIWDRRKNRFTNFNHIPVPGDENRNSNVTSIIRDRHDNIWLGSYGGGVSIYRHDTKTFEKIAFRSPYQHFSVWRLYLDNDGKIWASCLVGENEMNMSRLYRYSEAARTFEPVYPIKHDVISIVDDQKGSLWLGGFSVLSRLDKTKGVTWSMDFKSEIHTLHVSKSGILWIGTMGRGLMALHPESGKLQQFTEKNGLCNNKVLNIEEDHSGSLWVSTNNGLSKFNTANQKFENFYAADGLQSNQFYYNASARLASGELVFGGIKGFNVFHPDSIRQFGSFPRLILKELRIANTAVNSSNEYIPNKKVFSQIDHIRVPYDKAIISLDFVALEYSLPEKIQYAFFLKGRDRAWNYVGNIRNVNYSHLGEGTYQLHIKSTNASGIWNPHPKVITIEVLPPWYRTWWAYLLYLGTVGGLIFAYLHYHKKQTHLRLEMKFIKELNEKKISFFTNISHELRTPLTLIVNPIKDLLQSNGTNIDLIDLSAVYRNTRRLLSLVDQLLLFKSSENELADLKPAWFNLREVAYEVFLCFNNQVQAKNIDYQFLCPAGNIGVYADREKIEIVLFNLLSNAVKFTGSNGKIALEVTDGENMVELLVSDNGKGISPEAGHRLFEKFYRHEQSAGNTRQTGFGIGLFLAKQYIDLHQGMLTYTSVIGEGTIFKMSLPKRTSLLVRQPGDDSMQGADMIDPLYQELLTDTTKFESPAPVRPRKVQDVLSDPIIVPKPVILVIDDDNDVRNYLRNLLGSDYKVREAIDTDSGFASVLEAEPDIIVCDVVMQGLSGVEFCSKMKESPSFSHIPIILLTGTSSPEIKLKGIECGAIDYITKPFENDMLIARIRSTLKGRDTLQNYFLNEITLKNNNLKVPSEYSEFLTKCIAIVERHLNDESFSLKVFTEEIGMSKSTFARKIKAISGLSSGEFMRYIRLKKAAELMINTDLQVKEIAFQTGFQDMRNFRDQFNKLFEMNPSDFIRTYRKTFNGQAAVSLPGNQKRM